MMGSGKHVLCELSGCNPEILNDAVALEEIMRAAADDAGATVVNAFFHQFSPQGVTGVLVLSESHLSIHTWPELGYAAVDCYTCGDHTEPYRAILVMHRELQARSYSTMRVQRGVKRNDGGEPFYDLIG